MEDYMKERRDSDDNIHQQLEGKVTFQRHKNVKQAEKRANKRVLGSYYFLQYNAFIREWARKSLGATNKELDLLLWLNPIQIFTRKEFQAQMVGPFAVYKNQFKLLLDKGWVIKWDKTDRGYYVFTRRVTKILQEMHKMYFSENIDDISISFRPPKERDSKGLIDMYKKMFDKGTAKKD